MDLPLYARILWRFRLVVAVGFVLAVALAVLSIATPSLKGLHYRQHQTWTSTSTIWVTQSGFPLGRSIYDQYIQTGKVDSSTPSTPISKFSDPSRFSGLATVFVALVTSDGVRKIMARQGPIDGVVSSSQPTLPGNTSIVLPFVNVYGSAATPEAAERLSSRASRSLIAYVKDEQNANDISADKRVLLQVVQEAQPAVLSVPRSKARPIIVFLATMLVVIGVVFLLENVRPRVRSVPASDTQTTPAAAAGRLHA